VPLRGSHDDWETVAEVQQVFEAELLVLRLREAGIEAQALDSSFEQVPIPNVRNFENVRVLVPTGMAEQARRILKETVALPEDGEPAAAGGKEPGE
jgi:hypothetical protein